MVEDRYPIDEALIPPEISHTFTDRHLPENRLFQGIPGIESVPSAEAAHRGGGILYATWYAGGSGEGNENYVVLARSDDGGSTWRDPAAVIDPPGMVRAFDPGLWMDPAGRLWWYWNQSYGWFDGRAGVWATIADDPSDPEPVWSDPFRIADGVMMNKPVVLTHGSDEGAWAFPAAVWNRRPKIGQSEGDRIPELESRIGSNLVVTRDRGRSFEFRRGPDLPERSFDEHMLIECRDGWLLMLIRTYYGIAGNVSDDDGKTWRPMGPSNVYRVGPSTRFFIRRLFSGKLLLVYHESVRERTNLTAYVSDDDGASWSSGLLLDDRPSVSYPDGTQDEDGEIHIIYDRERTGAREILMTTFTEKDVAADSSGEARPRLRTVSKAGRS